MHFTDFKLNAPYYINQSVLFCVHVIKVMCAAFQPVLLRFRRTCATSRIIYRPDVCGILFCSSPILHRTLSLPLSLSLFSVSPSFFLLFHFKPSYFLYSCAHFHLDKTSWANAFAKDHPKKKLLNNCAQPLTTEAKKPRVKEKSTKIVRKLSECGQRKCTSK